MPRSHFLDLADNEAKVPGRELEVEGGDYRQEDLMGKSGHVLHERLLVFRVL